MAADLAGLLRAARHDASRLDEALRALAATRLYVPVERGRGPTRTPLTVEHDQRRVVPVFTDEDDLTHALPDGQPYIAVEASVLGASWDEATWAALHVGDLGLWLSPGQVRSLAD
ncbi:MAG: SseB family protein [Egibacteraceae bacterium]